MTSENRQAGGTTDLRRKAETLADEWANHHLEQSQVISPEEIRRTLYELRVHQIELEMQNEELQSAQEQIEAGRARYFDLYNMAPVGYCTLSESDEILDINFTACTLLGWPRRALIRQAITRHIFTDDLEVYHQHREALFTAGQRQECELRMIKSDGTWFWAQVVKTAARAEDGATVCRMVISDITVRCLAEARNKKLQAQLTQAQKIESLGRLAGGIAHDFNNMLGVILGYTELALGRVEPEHALYTYLKETQKAANYSVDLTSQLLAFARKQAIVPKVLLLNETVEDIITMLRRLIGGGIIIDFRPAFDLWRVRMDPAQIDQVLTNLCVNARDAIGDVGRIVIETRNVVLTKEYCQQQVDIAAAGEYVMLSVTDDGCGIDADTIALVFEPFFTTRETGKGVGLGLAIVYGVVKQNDGFISVRSEPGRGTSFEIYLPRHSVGSAGVRKKRSVRSTLSRGDETILLVDDEPSILAMTALMLESQGYTVLAASSPTDAIALANEYDGQIQLLLTDVVMPETNGRDLAKSVLAKRPGLKCLFMSGYTADVITHREMQGDGEFYIQKPFSLKKLSLKIRKILDLQEDEKVLK